MRARAGMAALAIAMMVTGCGDLEASLAPDSGKAGKADTADVGEARKKLKDLVVKGRAPKTGFDRDEFGPAWADVDHNGCDTRNDILKRDLREEKFKAGTHDCVVLTGVLDDPYSGKRIDFRRGQDTSSEVQIDHLIPLSDAWQKGAQKWTESKRKEFANDPLNLLAVDGPLNGQKSDSDAATWLPPRKSYRCAYIARQIDVKAKYELWVTSGEKDAMERVLSAC
ncbi:HNH endonuclease family protein [Nonomuraea sp. SBT364]|uniref:HNH endonuclease family protein n=1 Tax=Nonomuraea sp. SBT364 TaxID=1580530 RepID=UPI001E2D0A4A|nr:HNH endonuclease family protein [Nonomuraea sp. SBT364]